MAHELDFSIGRAAMAYTGETPWHGFGEQLTPGASIEEWQRAAGLEWEAMRAAVRFATSRDPAAPLQRWEDQVVLFRSDTLAPLGLVSDGYKPVQPREVVEFFRDAAESMDCTLETAGALKGGRIAWALARNGHDVTLGASDVVRRYVLLSTSFDGSRRTEAKETNVRVVCNNTFTASHKDAAAYSCSHRSKFDASAAKRALGYDAPDTFGTDLQAMAAARVEIEQAADYFVRIYHGITAQQASLLSAEDRKPIDKTVQRLSSILYAAPGQSLDTAKGTAWGLFNAVTHDVDFQKPARSQENRLTSAWFGAGDTLKQAAYGAALALAA